jgi:type III restriction enzyme
MLRDAEQAKIHCGHEHFKALGEEARYMVASNYETFLDQATSGK